MNVQDMAEQVFLRYLQRWGKDFLRRRLDWTLDEDGGNPASPRHYAHALCPCQYVEEILRNKEPRDSRACCPPCNDWLRRRGLDWPNRQTCGKSTFLNIRLNYTRVNVTHTISAGASQMYVDVPDSEEMNNSDFWAVFSTCQKKTCTKHAHAT